MFTAKNDQQLESIVTVSTSLHSYLAQSSNGDKERTTTDVAQLSHRSYVSFYSDPSAYGIENLMTTDTIELSHSVNPDVKKKIFQLLQLLVMRSWRP